MGPYVRVWHFTFSSCNYPGWSTDQREHIEAFRMEELAYLQVEVPERVLDLEVEIEEVEETWVPTAVEWQGPSDYQLLYRQLQAVAWRC